MMTPWNDIYLSRLIDNGIETIGFMTYFDGKSSIGLNTLELPWVNNRANESCIPPGLYEWDKRFSPHFKFDTIILKDVPGREYIEIHPANFVSELRGCIAVGRSKDDINKDDQIDMVNSRKAFNNLMSAVPESGYIHIVNTYIKSKIVIKNQ